MTVNLDECLDILFGLDQVTDLNLVLNRMSLDKIKSAFSTQGEKCLVFVEWGRSSDG
jgi:hypothetical protein